MRVLGRILALFAAFLFASGTAYAQVTPGVQQSAARTATITGTVTQYNGAPAAGATVGLTGPAILNVHTDSRGSFIFIGVPFGRYQISASSHFGTASQVITVAGDLSVAIQYAQNTTNLRTIASVTTKSQGSRINVTPASIASVSPASYAFSGGTSWKELLNGVPGVAVSDNAHGGATSADAIPLSPFNPAVVSINGAAPYETSVTIDGMPFNNVSSAEGAFVGNGVDLSNVPLTTFDAADVVRGPGANAPSIVDSIGGSLVLHGPGAVSQNQYEMSIGNDPYGGVAANWRLATRLRRLSFTLGFGMNNSPGPFGNTTGIFALTPKPLTINGQPFFGCTPTGGACSSQASNTPTYQQCLCNGTALMLIGGIPVDSSWTNHGYSASFAYNIGASVIAEVFLTGSSSHAQQPGLLYPINFTPGPAYSGSIAPGMHFLNDQFNGVGTNNDQSSHLIEEKITAYTGKGVLRVAGLQNVSYQVFHTPNVSQMTNGIYPVWGVAYTGTTSPGTPVVLNGTPQALTFRSLPLYNSIWSNSRDLLFSYSADVGNSSSVGLSYVTSYYNGPQAALLGTTSIGTSSAASETTNELRVNASTNVSDRLSADASWYFALGAYHVPNPADSSGATWTDAVYRYNAPRLGLVWRTGQNAAIRAAAGGGFALPQLRSLLGSSVPFCFGGSCTVTPPNLALKPEQSFGFDLGTDLRIAGSTVVSFDLYRTNLFGQFFSATSQTGTFNGSPLFTTQMGNLTATRYEGINLDARREPARGLYWHAAIGLTRGYLLSVPAGFYNGVSGFPATPCTNCVNTNFIPGPNFNGKGESTVPYANGTAALGYRWQGGTFIDVTSTYFGNGNTYYQPAFMEFDAHAGYQFTKSVSLFLNFRNITGIHGENYQIYQPTLGAPTVGGQQPYPLFGIPYGPRALTLTLNIKGASSVASGDSGI